MIENDAVNEVDILGLSNFSDLLKNLSKLCGKMGVNTIFGGGLACPPRVGNPEVVWELVNETGCYKLDNECKKDCIYEGKTYWPATGTYTGGLSTYKTIKCDAECPSKPGG